MFKNKIIKCPFIETCNLQVVKERYETHCRVETRLPQTTYQICWKYVDLMSKAVERKKPSEWLKGE